MRARFIGDPRHGGEGPALLPFMGVDFAKGVWVEDISDQVATKVSGNSHFEVDGEPLADEEIDQFVAPVVANIAVEGLALIIEGLPAAAVEALDLGEPAPITPPDLDGDGNPGGSLPADAITAERAKLIADIVSLGGAKPHHMTGLPKLRAQLDALLAA